MAPTLSNIDHMKQSETREPDLGRRRAPNCVGWHCLTTAEQFGIIFSIVVVSVVLIIAYMYLLGRMGMRQRDRKSVPLPGGRAGTRRSHLPPDIVMGNMPVVQQWPGYPPQVVYLPAVYQLAPGQVPRAQPCTGAGPLAPQPAAFPCPVPPYRPLLGYQASMFPQIVLETEGIPPPQDPPPPFPDHGRQSRETTWRQRLSQLFQMPPVGRASTVASSFRSTTPRTATPRSATPIGDEPGPQSAPPLESQSSQARHQSQRPREAEEISVPCRRRSPPASQVDAEFDETESLESNVATVHSDDFYASDTEVRSTAVVQNHMNLDAHSAADRRLSNAVVDEEEAEGVSSTSDGSSGLRESIPSMSSYQPRVRRVGSGKTANDSFETRHQTGPGMLGCESSGILAGSSL